MTGLAFVAVNLLTALASWCLAARFLPRHRLADRLLAAALLAASQIALSLFFLGLVLDDLSAGLQLGVNGALAAAVLIVERRRMAPSLAEACRRLAALGRELASRRDWIVGLMAVLFLLQTGLLLVKIQRLPPDVGDVYSYHLHPVAEWTQQNRIVLPIDSPVTRVNRNPHTPKLLQIWTLLACGDTRWLELPQFLFGLLVPLAVFALQRRIGVGRHLALRLSLLAYFTPSLLIESRTCQDHLILNSAILIALLFLIDVVYEQRRAAIPFLGLALGWILGSKISGPHIAVILAAATVLSRGFSARAAAAWVRRHLGPVLGATGLALALGAYWYAESAAIRRSYWHGLTGLFTARPVWLLAAVLGTAWLFRSRLEAAFNRLGARIRKTAAGRPKRTVLVLALLAALAVAAASERRLLFDFLVSRQNPAPQLVERAFFDSHPLLRALNGPLLKNLLLFPYRIKDIGNFSLYTPDLHGQSGFGVAFFAFGLPAYLLAAWSLRRREFRRRPEGMLALFAFLLLLSYFSYYYTMANYRLFIFFPLLGLVLWGRWGETVSARPARNRVLGLMMAAMMVWSGLVCLLEGNANWRAWKTTLTVSDPEQRTPAKFSNLLTGSAWQFLDRYLDPREPIAYTGHFDSQIYPYFDARLQRRIYHLATLPGYRTEPAGPGQARVVLTPALVESLRRLNVHVIHLNAYGAHHLSQQADRLRIEDPRAIPLPGDLYFFDG